MSGTAQDGFRLHETIEAHSLQFCRLSLCSLRILNDRRFPWLVLVPELPNLRELHDVPEAAWVTLGREIRLTSRVLQAVTGADKINIGALGNITPQLHIHVIARFTTDSAWPGSVWGKEVAVAYDRTEADEFARRLKTSFDAATLAPKPT
jgi:diadenosine tetraphosphate (Ap4A) HIT family hydrolase